MFHGGTPLVLKSHILQQMVNGNSHLRIVICTIAFGMGVNCKGVYESVHFGPSKSIPQFVQESGRIGRNGKPSISRLFHNPSINSRVDTKMREFINVSTCLRKALMSMFSNPESFSSSDCGCQCCDICAEECHCSKDKWKHVDFFQLTLPFQIKQEKQVIIKKSF